MEASADPRPHAADAGSRVEALELFVALLADMDGGAAASGFYDRLCQAVCRLTSMERAALLLYDGSVRRVLARGFHGFEPGELADAQFTLEDAPIAQRALAADRVVEASEEIEREVPARYARLFGITTLTCIPLSAAGHWFGVVFADRGGGRFTLTETERSAAWTVGKVAALAASARAATRQQDLARGLAERIDLAREIHERVTQRIFGISMALGADRELTAEDRARCRDEARAALGELRTAMTRPLAPATRVSGPSLREELERLSRGHRDLGLVVHWPPEVVVPPELDPLAQSVLREALRNAGKHARPSRVEVKVDAAGGNLALEVVNDGARGSGGGSGSGMGLRLAAFEALRQGGVLEFGPGPEATWRVRLVVPLPAERPAS